MKLNSKINRYVKLPCPVLSIIVVAGAMSHRSVAAQVDKADNSETLNVPSSWIGAAVPGPADVATWNSAVSAANSTSLGADLSWKGIAIISPGGGVAINGPNVLTVGTSGIDLSAASQNLVISSNLTLGSGGQQWNIPAGRSLTLDTGTFTRTPGTALRINAGGTIATSMAGLVNTNSIIGPWATVTAGAIGYATLDAGTIVPITGTAAANFGWASGNNNTFNYDVAATSANLGVNRAANTVRYTGVAGTQNYGNNNTATLTINGLLNAGVGPLTLSEAGGASQGQVGIGINNNNELVLDTADSAININIPIINTGATAGSILVTGSNTVTINSSGGASTYSGATTVSGGTLLLNGSGSINSSIGINVKGAGAKFIHASSVAGTAPVSVTEGTLDGMGKLGAVVIGSGLHNVLANGNGGIGSLAMESLTFGGTATVNASFQAGATPIVVTGALVTAPANGKVTVNVNAAGLPNGNHNIISAGSFSGSGSDFIFGSVTGLNERQSHTFGLSGPNVVLEVSGDSPRWTGAGNGNWTVFEVAPPKNWMLVSAGTPTDFIDNDNVLFDDSATGTTTVDIVDGNVFTGSVTFSNSTKPYTISSSGGYGIASGSLTKNGTGLVTINTANTYSGATTINSGTLQLGNGTIDGTLSGTSNIINNGSLVFNRSVGTFTYSGTVSGGGSVTKAGPGTQVLNGANTFTGGIQITGGTLAANAAGVAANAIALSSGTTWNINGSGVYANSVTSSGPATVRYSGGAAQATLSGDWSGFTGTYEHAIGVQSTVFTNTSSTSGTTAYAQTASGSGQGFIMGIATGGTFHFGSLSTILPAGLLRNANATTGISVAEVGALNSDTTWAGGIGGGGGTIALTKVGNGNLTLTGINTYNGNTVVSAGTLTLADNAALRFVVGANGVSNSVSGVGTLALDGDFNFDVAGAALVGGNSWKLVSVETLNETFGASFTVTGYTENGNVHTRVDGENTWKFSESTGILTLTIGAGSYDSWATVNAGGQAPNLDFDNDGVMNGVEYFMGAGGTTFTSTPSVVDGKITWSKDPSFSGSYSVQTSTDLVSWTDASSSVVGNTVEYLVPADPGKLFIRLKVLPD